MLGSVLGPPILGNCLALWYQDPIRLLGALLAIFLQEPLGTTPISSMDDPRALGGLLR